MAVIKKNGRYSGKVGNTVFTTWGDLDIIKSAPRRSRKPAPPAKKAANSRFGMVSSFLAPLRQVVDTGYARQRVGAGTGFNAAMSQVMKQAIRGVYPAYYIHYPSVRLSGGGLEAAAATLELQGTQGSISWGQPADTFNSSPRDAAFVALFFEEAECFSFSRGLLRQDGQWTFDIPGFSAGSTLHAWLFFRSANGRRCSDSVYLQGSVPGSGNEQARAPAPGKRLSVQPILAGVVQPLLSKRPGRIKKAKG